MSAAAPDPSHEPIWTRAFVTVLAAQMAFGYASSMFMLLPKYLATHLHASASEIGHAIAATGVAAVLAMPFIGAALERFGRKPLILLGCVLTALYAFAWLAVSRLSFWIAPLQALGGIGFMIAFNAAATIVADQAPPARLGQAIGIFGASNLVMSAIAPAVAEVLAVRVGWHAAFGLAGFVALFALVLALRIDETGHHVGRASSAAEGDAFGFSAMFSLMRRQRAQCVAMTACGAAYTAVTAFYQPFVIAQGAQHVSQFFVGFTCAAVSVRMFLGSLADRAGRRRTAIGSFLAYAVMVMAMALLTPGRLLVFGFCFGCAHGVFQPAVSAMCVEQAALHERGRVMTMVMGFFRLGNVASALALGWVAELYGYRFVFVLAGLVNLLGVAALVANRDDKQDKEIPSTVPTR